MDLKFRIRGQALNAYIPDPVVSETVDYYRALFSFSPDWDGLDKWLHLKDSDGNTYDAVLEEDMVSPLNLTAGLWEAWLHGHEMTDGKPTLRITTQTVSFRIAQSGALEGGEVLPVVETTVAEQVAANAAYAKATVEKLVAESDALFEAAAKAETYMENAQGSAEAAHVDAQGAHQAREAIEGMSVETIALDPGSEATVEKTMLGDFVKLIFGLPRGERGTVGPKGDPGTSVVALAHTAGDSSPGTYDTYTLQLSDGKTFDMLVYNGADGKDGAGDMAAAIYDPRGKAEDVFGYVDAKIAATPIPEVKALLDSHVGAKNNPHGVTASQVGLGNVPNVSTNNQTPTYTLASTLANLTSGETLSVSMGKIAKAIANLLSHLADKGNPHGITAGQIQALPLAGGALTGQVIAPGFFGNGAYSIFSGHADTSKNSYIQFYNSESDAPGQMLFVCRDGANEALAILRPDGTFIWNGNPVYHAGNITSGPTDLDAGVSSLTSGAIYLVYE